MLNKLIKKSGVLSTRRASLRMLGKIESQVKQQEAHLVSGTRPVILFVASAHIKHFGLGAAGGLISSWALRLAGVPVIYFICQRGLTQCVLGSNREGMVAPPPCKDCIAHRNEIYPSQLAHKFIQAADDTRLRADLQKLSWEELICFTKDGIEFGKLCLPSLRWVQRRFNLIPDDFTRYMLTEYILSSVHLAKEFSAVIEQAKPQAVIAMNGTHFPEAVVREVALAHRVRVITFESGLRGDTLFFTDGIATEYPIYIPSDFIMGIKENEALDVYLDERSKGKFSIAGRRQWTKMESLPLKLQDKTKIYRQIVTVFANTVWDTSQAYANRFFGNMFEWLDKTLRYSDLYPDTLFIVRAHPDEARPGKVSNESVADWMKNSGYEKRDNVFFIAPEVHVNSYELIKLAKFCLVYNSTIGIEAAMMGKTVLPGGWTRYRNANACLDANSYEDYVEKLKSLLEFKGDLPSRPDLVENARRYYYFSQFRAVVDISGFIEHLENIEYKLKPFPIAALDPAYSKDMQVIVDGILQNKEFVFV